MVNFFLSLKFKLKIYKEGIIIIIIFKELITLSVQSIRVR